MNWLATMLFNCFAIEEQVFVVDIACFKVSWKGTWLYSDILCTFTFLTSISILLVNSFHGFQLK